MTGQGMWRRRVALMAVVGLVVALPITLLIRDGEGDESTSREPATTAAAPPPQVGPGVRDRGLDVSYRVPEGWDESKKASAIRLTSPDGTAELVIAAPAPASEADPLLDETLAAFKAQYDKVRIARGSGRKIGGVKAKGAVVQAAQGKDELRVLVAVAPGKKRAYLVEVFTTAGVLPSRLREAQVALNSLKFTN